MAAFFAWLAVFPFQLFSTIFGMNLNYLTGFRSIEVYRWHQPVCTSVGPCYQSHHRQYEKVVNVREVRDTIHIDELEPSTIDTPEMFEKLYAPERQYRGLYSYDEPAPITVTKVIDSPIVATIITPNCIDGVPSCDEPTRVPIRLPEEDYVLGRTLGALEAKKQSLYDVLANKKQSLMKAMSNVAQAQHGYVQAFVEKKQHAIEEIVQEVKDKKDAMVQAVVNKTKSVVNAVEGVKQSIVDTFTTKKDAIVNAVSSAAAAKHDFVEGVLQAKKDKVMTVVDAVHEKKEQVAGAVSSAAAAKHQFVADLIQKKKDNIKVVADAVHEKKDQVVDAVSSVAAAKHEFIEDIVQQKKEKIHSALNALHDTKDKVIGAKKQFVEGVIESKKDKIEAVVDAVHEKKDQVVEAVSNAAAAKHQFVEGIIEKKKEKVQSAVNAAHDTKDKVVEAVSNAAAAKHDKIKSIVDHKKEALNNFMEAKDKFEQDLAAKKQEFVKNMADKKINAIKHVSEKTQEYIGTASLMKPLAVSQIKQIFNKDKPVEDNLEEELEKPLEDKQQDKTEDQEQEDKSEDESADELEKKSDEGGDFIFADEDARSFGLFKDILKKKHKLFKTHNKISQAAAPVETPNRPVGLTQQAESSLIHDAGNIDAHDPIDSEETIEIIGSSTTEKVIAAPESHVLPSFEETPTEVFEGGPPSNPKQEEASGLVNSVGSFEEATHEETSSTTAESLEDVATKIDRPAIDEQPITSFLPLTDADFVIEQNNDQAASNNDTFTFNAELLSVSQPAGEGEKDSSEDPDEEEIDENNNERSQVNAEAIFGANRRRRAE